MDGWRWRVPCMSQVTYTRFSVFNTIIARVFAHAHTPTHTHTHTHALHWEYVFVYVTATARGACKKQGAHAYALCGGKDIKQVCVDTQTNLGSPTPCTHRSRTGPAGILVLPASCSRNLPASCIHTGMHLFIHAGTLTNTYVACNTHTHTHTKTYLYAGNIQPYIHTWMHTCIVTCIHTYMHTYIHPFLKCIITVRVICLLYVSYEHTRVQTYINTCLRVCVCVRVCTCTLMSSCK